MKEIKEQRNLKKTNHAKDELLHMLAADEEKFLAFKLVFKAMLYLNDVANYASHQEYVDEWLKFKRDYNLKCRDKPYFNKEFTLPTLACDYSLQQKNDSGHGTYMDLDNECVLKLIRWQDDTSLGDLFMSKAYRMILKRINEAAVTNISSKLTAPTGVQMHEGEL